MTSLPSFDFEIPVQDDQPRQPSSGEESPVLPPVFRSTLVAQDVVIPAHLLQAIGNTSSARDTAAPPAWQPGSPITTPDNRPWKRYSGVTTNRHRPMIQRSSTAPGEAGRSRVSSLSSPHNHMQSQHIGSEKAGNPKRASLPSNTAPRKSWRLSYTPGQDSLSVKKPAQNQGQPKPNCYSRRSIPQSPSNPFESLSNVVSRSSSPDSVRNPFLTKENSLASGKSTPSSHSRSSSTSEPERAYVPGGSRPRRGTVETIVDAIVPDALQQRLTNVSYTGLARRSSLRDTYEKAKERGVQLQRNKFFQWTFRYGIYIFMVLFVYFVLVGIPLWNGAVWWLYWVVSTKFVLPGGFGIVLGIALFYAFAPLLVLFEKDPPAEEITTETKIQPNVQDTALLIPCYKSAGLIAATLEAALKIFPPSHIFVLANGNSAEPLDNTEEICQPYGVNHIWSPIGSKIVAQFVGCYAAKDFKNVLLIDDDCALPENFPVVTDRLVGKVKCIGYTIKSVGPNSSKGNYCQQ